MIMLSCLLRKGLNLPKQKSLKAEVSLYPQTKYHLQAGSPPFLLVQYYLLYGTDFLLAQSVRVCSRQSASEAQQAHVREPLSLPDLLQSS